MNDRGENTPSPERPLDTRVPIEPELLARLEVYADILRASDVSEAQLMLDFGMIDISTESIVNSAVRSFLKGVDQSLHDDPSDL